MYEELILPGHILVWIDKKKQAHSNNYVPAFFLEKCLTKDEPAGYPPGTFCLLVLY